MTDTTKRINLTVPNATHAVLVKNIPDGMRNNVYLSLLAKFADLLEAHGSRAPILDVLEGKFEIVCKGIAKKQSDHPA